MTFTGSIITGSSAITGVSSTVGLQIGYTISGTGITAGTTIVAIDGDGITMSAPATTNGLYTFTASPPPEPTPPPGPVVLGTYTSPTDTEEFLEAIEDASPWTATVSERGGNVVVPYRFTATGGQDLCDAVAKIVGWTNVDPSQDGSLSRTPPLNHPMFPYWCANSVSIRGIGDPEKVGASVQLPPIYPDPVPNYALYDQYELGISFGPRAYLAVKDDAITGGQEVTWVPNTPPEFVAPGESITSVYANEWERYTDIDIVPANDYIQGVQGMSMFATKSGNSPAKLPFSGMPRLLLPNQVVKISWFQIPLRYWTSPNSFLRQWVSHINYRPFFDWGGSPLFGTGQLLYLGATPKMYTSVVSQFQSFSGGTLSNWKYMDVEMLFLVTYRTGEDVPDPVGNVITAGHNLLPYFPKQGFYYAKIPNGAIASCNVTSGNTSQTLNAGTTTALEVGMTVSGPGIPTGTTIVAIVSSTVFQMSAAATATNATAPLVFADANGTTVGTPYYHAFPMELLFTDPDTNQPDGWATPG